MLLEHFIAMCCYGGEPFIDFHVNGLQIDPTDWSADVIKDANYTIHSVIPLGNCTHFNITFTNLADQNLFDTYKANFLCRCPFDRFGTNCQSITPISSKFSQHETALINIPISMILILAAVALALMAVLMMMMRGCFCDCFGPFSREDPYEKPLDPEDVRICLQKVRENQARREMASEPLVAHPPPSQPLVSDSYSAPYPFMPSSTSDNYPSAPPMPYRPSSPPPAYSDIDRTPANLTSTQI